jgi:hypothetical protein
MKTKFRSASPIRTLGAISLLLMFCAFHVNAANIKIIFAIYENPTASPASCQHHICFKNQSNNQWEKELSVPIDVKVSQNDNQSDKLKFIKDNPEGSDSDNYCFRPTFFYDEEAYNLHGLETSKKQAIRDPRFEIWPFDKCSPGGDSCPANPKRPFTNSDFERTYKKKNKTRLWSANPNKYPFLQANEQMSFLLKIEAKPKRDNGRCRKGNPRFVSGDPRVRVVRI